MFSKIPILLISFLLMLPLQVLADDGNSTPPSNDCANIVSPDNTEGTSAPTVKSDDDWKLCKGDFSATAVNMLFNEAYKTDGFVQQVFDWGGMPKPNDAGYKMISGLIDMTAYSVASLFFKVFIPIYFIALVVMAVKLAKGAKAKETLKNKESWYAVGSLFLLAFMLYPVDKYMLGQVLVIGAAIFALKLGLFVLSNTISIFDFNASIDSEFDDYTLKRAAEEVASAMILEQVAARQSALRLNRYGMKSTEREVNDEPSDLDPFVGVGGHGEDTSRWLDGSSDEKVTNQMYATNALAQSVVYVSRTPVVEPVGILGADWGVTGNSMGYQMRLSYGQTASSQREAIAHSSLTDLGDTGDAYITKRITHSPKFFEPYAIENEDIKALYQQPMISQNSISIGSAPDVTYSGYDEDIHGEANIQMIDSIREMGLQGALQSSDWMREDLGETELAGLANRIVLKAQEFSKQFYGDSSEGEIPFIQTSTSFLMGYHSIGGTDISGKSASEQEGLWFAYNPNKLNALRQGEFGDSRSLVTSMMARAQDASFELSRMYCLGALNSEKGDDAENVISQLRLYVAVKNEGESVLSTKNAPTNHSGQCLYYDNSGIKTVFPDDFVAIAESAFEDRNLIQPENLKAYLVGQAGEKLADDIDAASLKAKEAKRDIYAAMYNVQRVLNLAGKQLVAESTGEEMTLNILNSLRTQGLASVVGYLARVAQELSNASNKIKDSHVPVEANVFVDAISLTPPRSIKETEEEGDKDKELEMAAAFMNVGGAVKEFLGSGSVAALKGAPTGMSISATLEGITDYLVGMVLLDQSILAKGFGVNGDSYVKGLAGCSDGGCYKFSQHPIITLSLYGSELLFGGLVISVLSAFADFIAKGISSLGDVIGGLGDSLGGGIASSAVSVVASWGMSLVGVFAKVVSVIFSILMQLIAPIGMLYLVLGALLCFFLPVIPIVGYLMSWIMWLLELAMVFVFFPIFLALWSIKVEGRRLLSSGKAMGLYLSLMIKPVLFLSSFILFFAMTYVVIYLINSLAGVMLSSFAVSGIYMAMMQVLSMMVILYLYYKCISKVHASTQELPNRILSYIGVQGFDVGGLSDTESMLGASGLASGFKNTINGAGQQVSKALQKKEYDKVREQERADITNALKEQGIDMGTQIDDALKSYRGDKR